MEDMLVMVFDSEAKAYEGSKALQDLENEGSINLFSKAVIVKDADGKVSVKKQDAGSPVGLIIGLLAGSLFGLPGGALGVTIGASAGSAGGLGYDLAHLGVGQDFLNEVEQSLQPGKAAVVAEVYGEWSAAADARVNALRCSVFRCPLSEVLDTRIQETAAALQADLSGLQTGIYASVSEAHVRLQKRVDAARHRLQAEQDAIQAEIEESQKETEAKIRYMQEQAEKANREQKAEVDKKIAQLQAHHKRRNNLLKQAWELIKKTLST